MENKDKKIIGIIIIILTTLVAIWFLNRVFDFTGLKKEPDVEVKTYSLADFPEAGKFLDAEGQAKNIQGLNNRYLALATGKGERTEYQNWIDIGIFRKNLNDLSGAEEVWIKAATLLNKPWIAYGNLADLYLYRTKELDKAEEMYKKAIELNPVFYTFHEGLANLYRYDWSKTHKEKVEGVILNAVDKDAKDTKAYYQYLISFFTVEGNEDKVSEYEQKLESL